MKSKSEASRSFGGTVQRQTFVPQIIKAAALSWLALFAGGCIDGSPTYGTVQISHPQVFTRERLVIARERELQFLNKALDETVSTTIQGADDVRTLSAFENNLALTLSPTPTSTAATPATLSDLSKLALASPADTQFAKGLGISSVDHFNDVMAYRDAVNSVIREKELDDEHDRRGTTLYTLKFNCSLFPGINTKAPAVVQIHLTDPEMPSEAGITELYYKWIELLNERLNDDENALQVRVDRKQLGPNDLELVVTYLDEAKDQFDAIVNSENDLTPDQKKYCISKMEAAAEKTLGFFWLPPESRQSALADLLRLDRAEDHLKFIIGLQACLYAKYQHQFAGLVSFKYKFTPLGSTNIDIGGFLIPYEPQLDPGKRWASSTAAGLSYFTKIIKDWTQKPYVDSIDPQIYAQNISDVSSKTKLVDVAFAVSAVLGKAGTLSDNARSLNQSQTLLQAIKRQPLSVSYASGTNFGWMMGPSYTIQDGKAVFLQSFEKESFSAAIVLPVWARALKLNGQVTWLGDDGTPARTDPLELQTVDLPSDLDALTSAIQERQAAHLPKPTLYASELSLQAGAKGDQTLLIFGRELWRNPEVFFGSTKADTVDLLPDMKGLLAHFSSVPTNSSTNVDLTVVTSFGSASLDNAVIISPPEKRVVAASGPPAKMMTAFAVNGSIPLYFGLNTNVISPGYAGFSFKLSLPEKPGDWVKIDDSAATLSSNGTRLSISVKLPDPQPPTPVKYTLDLGIRRTPYESPTSLLADTKSNLDSFVYFPAKDEEKPKLSLPNPAIIAYKPEGPDVPSMVLRPADSVKLADLYAAYPGLQTSVKSGAAKFSLKAAGQDPRTFLLKEDSGGWLVAVPAKVEDLPAATYDTITIEYQAVGTVTVNLPVLGGPITVKKQ